MASSTKKRGQTMALFLLLGIVLIAVVGFMLFLRGGMEGTGVEDAADLGLSTTSFKAHAHQCLRQEVLNAVDKYGLLDGQGPYIGAYVRKNLPKCIEWDFYEEQGFAITAGNPEVQVEIAPDTLLVDVKYPIEGEDERGAFSFEELYYYLPRGRSGQLRFDGADRTEEEVSVSSSDGDAELIIPEGTVVKDAAGNLIEKVELRVLERDFNGLVNPLIVGMVAYEITPHVTFSNPVTLKMTYREQDIPSGVKESTLRLAQFERKYNMWFSVPTTVDTAKNTLTASFTHFSPVAAVVRCGDGTYYEFPSSESWRIFFSQNCNDRGSAEGVAWDTDEEKNLFEDQNGNIESLVFLPAEKNAETGEYDAGTGPEGQAVGLNQVSLSPCTINDWDKDDRIDTVDQVTTECVHVTYQEGEGAQPIEAVEELDAGECAGADLQTFLESCQSFVNEESIGRQDAFKQQEELAGRDIPTQDGIKDHESFEEETVSGCFRQIDESGNSVVGGGNWNPATPNTYGYRAVEGIDNPWDLPGGFGVLRFRFAGNGGACIAQDQDGKLMIELGISLVPGEEYGEDLYDFKINPYMGTKDDPEFLKLTPADSGTAAVADAWKRENWDTYKGTLEAGDFDVYSLVDGEYFWNEIYVRLDNADGGGALIAALNEFVIHGTGVTFDVPHPYERCGVTVQERINYLCGCDTPGCTGDWGVGGVGSELSLLANWRGAWNPSAGSVVNGQTLLCDLDMADSKITALRESGWTPFGGYCGDDGPVGMERVVTGGECTTVGMGACDYATNNAVECVQVAPEAAEAGTPESTAAAWQVMEGGACAEGQVCRIMGGGVTCVGETDVEFTVCPGMCVSRPTACSNAQGTEIEDWNTWCAEEYGGDPYNWENSACCRMPSDYEPCRGAGGECMAFAGCPQSNIILEPPEAEKWCDDSEMGTTEDLVCCGGETVAESLGGTCPEGYLPDRSDGFSLEDMNPGSVEGYSCNPQYNLPGYDPTSLGGSWYREDFEDSIIICSDSCTPGRCDVGTGKCEAGEVTHSDHLTYSAATGLCEETTVTFVGGVCRENCDYYATVEECEEENLVFRGDYCVHDGESICTLGLPPTCSPCPTGKVCTSSGGLLNTVCLPPGAPEQEESE